MTLAGDTRHDTIDNRLDTAGFFVPHPAYEKYQRMHKELADITAVNQLLDIHDQLMTVHNTSYLYAGGWAAAEAALIATNHTTDDRLSYLQAAATSWDRATLQQRQSEAERGLLNEYQSMNVTRLQLAKIFIPLMEGMVSGDVSKQIRAETYANLLDISVQNAISLNVAIQNGQEGKAGSHIGLAHELNGMIAVNWLQSPTLIVIPAIARADMGSFYPKQTHDLQLLRLDHGEILGVTPLEAKARLKPKHYKRYEATLLDGRIHLYAGAGRSPIDTLQLFLKEHTGQATTAELAEIEHITNTIVHLVRHRWSEIPGVSAQCKDITRCDKIPRDRSGSIPKNLAHLAIAS